MGGGSWYWGLCGSMVDRCHMDLYWGLCRGLWRRQRWCGNRSKAGGHDVRQFQDGDVNRVDVVHGGGGVDTGPGGDGVLHVSGIGADQLE